jgi:hypothetical protein
MRRETPRSSLGGGAEVGPRMVGPPSGFKLRVVSSRQLTPTSHAIELEKPNAFMFRRGAQWGHGSDVEASDVKHTDVVCIRAIEK